MQVFEKYLALRELLPMAEEADFSSVPKESDTPFLSLVTEVFPEDFGAQSRVLKISLPSPVIPRYAHIDSSMLSVILGMRRADVEWILRARYALRIEKDKFNIISSQEYFSSAGDGDSKVYIGAPAIDAAFDTIDPFGIAYSVETELFDPLSAPEVRDMLRERANLIAMLANGTLTKNDFVLKSIPVLPFVAELARDNQSEFFKSKISVLTYRLWRRVQRLKGFIESGKMPLLVIVNEQRMVQEASDRLFAEYKLSGINFISK